MKTMPILLILTLSAAPALGQNDSFKGLTGVYVSVAETSDALERKGVSKQSVQTDVELELRRGGVPMFSRDQWFEEPGRPWIAVSIETFTSGGLVVYNIIVRLRQDVFTVASPDLDVLDVPTWETGSYGTIGLDNVRQLRETVLDHVRRFVNEWQKIHAGSG